MFSACMLTPHRQCDQNHETAHKQDATAHVSLVVNIPTARPDGCSYEWDGGKTGLRKCCKRGILNASWGGSDMTKWLHHGVLP